MTSGCVRRRAGRLGLIFDPAVVRRELEIIKQDLGCSAIKDLRQLQS